MKIKAIYDLLCNLDKSLALPDEDTILFSSQNYPVTLRA